MQCSSAGRLFDLFTTAKSAGHDERILRLRGERGKQRVIRDRDREIVFVFFESECARHSAAIRRDHLDVRSGAAKHCFIGIVTAE
jgi:hypothetical protein